MVVRDPLRYWNGMCWMAITVYEICLKHSIPFNTEEYEFKKRNFCN